MNVFDENIQTAMIVTERFQKMSILSGQANNAITDVMKNDYSFLTPDEIKALSDAQLILSNLSLKTSHYYAKEHLKTL